MINELFVNLEFTPRMMKNYYQRIHNQARERSSKQITPLSPGFIRHLF